MLNYKHVFIGVLSVLTVQTNAELIPISALETPDKNTKISQLALSNKAARQKEAAQEKSDDLSITERLSALATSTVRNFTQIGVASWYGRQFHGQKTANGEVFNMNDLTAAHKTLPLNCRIRVTNKDNGKSVIVRVNDRGPFSGTRVVDLSYGAAKVLGIVDAGTANVSIERISN